MIKNTIKNAIKALENGEIIVYPTDTLYAMGVNIHNINAIQRLFEIKKRPFSVPLSVAVSNFEEIKKIAYTNKNIQSIVENFLPGQLTLLLKKKDTVSNLISSGKDTIAIRIPNNDIALRLISKFGPITATSANIHGKKPSHEIKYIKKQFQKNISVYLDDGILDEAPSTIIDLTSEKPKIARQGNISLKEVLKLI
jgi:L-threonylcarbamoyladenylate synthase